MTVANHARQRQIDPAPNRPRHMLTPRQLAIALATGAVSAWVWQRSGGDSTLTGMSTVLATAAFNHHVSK